MRASMQSLALTRDSRIVVPRTGAGPLPARGTVGGANAGEPFALHRGSATGETSAYKNFLPPAYGGVCRRDLGRFGRGGPMGGLGNPPELYQQQAAVSPVCDHDAILRRHEPEVWHLPVERGARPGDHQKHDGHGGRQEIHRPGPQHLAAVPC